MTLYKKFRGQEPNVKALLRRAGTARELIQVPKRILPAIVFAQFAGTSLWFAGNAILPQVQASWGLT